MKVSHILLPPAAVAFVAWYGGRITASGMDWYRTIELPAWTPAGSVIGMVWTSIFILSTLGIILYLRQVADGYSPWFTIGLLLVNALLNVGWSWLFFGQGLIGPAVLGAALLGLSVLAIIFAMWPASKTAALLFVPYAAWVAFATYLNYVIWTLN